MREAVAPVLPYEVPIRGAGQTSAVESLRAEVAQFRHDLAIQHQILDACSAEVDRMLREGNALAATLRACQTEMGTSWKSRWLRWTGPSAVLIVAPRFVRMEPVRTVVATAGNREFD